MKSAFSIEVLALAAFLSFFSAVNAQTVGFWRFNEKDAGQQADGAVGAILDSSGNGHHGTAMGDPLPSYVAGDNDKPSALELTVGNDVEDRIEIPHSPDFDLMLGDLQDYTIEAIVQLSPDTSYGGAIMTKRDTTGSGMVSSDGTIGARRRSTSKGRG